MHVASYHVFPWLDMPHAGAAEGAERGHGAAGVRGRADGGHHRGGRLGQGLRHPGERLHTAAGMCPHMSPFRWPSGLPLGLPVCLGLRT